MKRIAVLLIGLCAMLFCCAYAESTTIMMYMCGTDIQSDCVEDIKEICSANAGKDTNIVILAGGAKEWDDSSLAGRQLNLFTVNSGKRSSVTNWGKASMGSASTLEKFASYCEENYPADRKILILWDHGSTAAYGMCSDEVYNDDCLTLAELDQFFTAMRRTNGSYHLDILGADACLMASYEMACVAAPYADYFVASEELESWLGWYYVNWLNDLGKNPSMTNAELCKAIVKSFQYGCERDDPNDYHTLSAMDLSQIGTLKSAVDQLSQSLINSLDSSVSTLSRTVRSLYIYGSFDSASSDMVDLKALAESVRSIDAQAADAVSAAVDRVVTVNYATSSVPTANGISVFIPMENAQYLNEYKNDYMVSSIGAYDDFAIAFAESMNGGSYVFSGTSPYQLLDADTDSGFVSSAYGYSSDNDSCYWDWQDDGYSDSCDMGYGYGGGFGSFGTITIAGSAGSTAPSNTSNVTIAIAGTAGTSSSSGITIAGSVCATPAPASQIAIAGTASQTVQTVAPEKTPSGIVIAGSTPAPTQNTGSAVFTQEETVTVEIPEQLSSSAAFCVNLNSDDLEHLSYAELHVMMDVTEDDEGIYLLDLGRVRDTWVDWQSGRVDSLFDGSWASIEGLPVALLDQARTQYARRSLIPVTVNGENTYLVVRFLADSTEGTILGVSAGWSENGLPVRGVTPLSEGDRIAARYKLYYSDDPNCKLNDMETYEYIADDEEDIIIWDGTQTVTYLPLGESEYQLAFRLYDIYGEYSDTDSIAVTINA